MKAAGLSSAELVCHHDMWDFLAGMASGHPHFRTPPAVDAMQSGQVRTFLSGRSLVALLIVLWESRENATVLDADWALAATAYDRITHGLDAVTSQPGQRTVRMSLEDGIRRDPDDQTATTAPAEGTPPNTETDNTPAGARAPAGDTEHETAREGHNTETPRAATAEERRSAAEIELHALAMEDAAQLTPRQRGVRNRPHDPRPRRHTRKRHTEGNIRNPSTPAKTPHPNAARTQSNYSQTATARTTPHPAPRPHNSPQPAEPARIGLPESSTRTRRPARLSDPAPTVHPAAPERRHPCRPKSSRPSSSPSTRHPHTDQRTVSSHGCGTVRINHALAPKVAAHQEWQARVAAQVNAGIPEAEARKNTRVPIPTKPTIQKALNQTKGDSRTATDGTCPWWHEVNTYTFQSAFIDADKAWKNWLDSLTGETRRPAHGITPASRRRAAAGTPSGSTTT